MQYLRKFILSEGDLYQDLQPASNDLMPQKAEGSIANGFDGWSFMMRTENKKFALLYIENDAELPVLMNMNSSAEYILQWYNPEKGEWSEKISVETNRQGKLQLPAMPDPSKYWAAKLVEHGG